MISLSVLYFYVMFMSGKLLIIFEVKYSSEYSGLRVRAVRCSGNQLAIIQDTRNLTNIKPADAPQSCFVSEVLVALWFKQSGDTLGQ